MKPPLQTKVKGPSSLEENDISTGIVTDKDRIVKANAGSAADHDKNLTFNPQHK